MQEPYFMIGVLHCFLCIYTVYLKKFQISKNKELCCTKNKTITFYIYIISTRYQNGFYFLKLFAFELSTKITKRRHSGAKWYYTIFVTDIFRTFYLKDRHDSQTILP